MHKIFGILIIFFVLSTAILVNANPQTDWRDSMDATMKSVLFLPIVLQNASGEGAPTPTPTPTATPTPDSPPEDLCKPGSGPYLDPDGDGLVLVSTQVISGTIYPNWDEDEYHFDVTTPMASYTLNVRWYTAVPKNYPDAVYTMSMDIYNPQGGLEASDVLGFSISTIDPSDFGRWTAIIHGPSYKPEGIGCYQLKYEEK